MMKQKFLSCIEAVRILARLVSVAHKATYRFSVEDLIHYRELGKAYGAELAKRPHSVDIVRGIARTPKRDRPLFDAFDAYIEGLVIGWCEQRLRDFPLTEDIQ